MKTMLTSPAHTPLSPLAQQYGVAGWAAVGWATVWRLGNNGLGDGDDSGGMGAVGASWAAVGVDRPPKYSARERDG